MRNSKHANTFTVHWKDLYLFKWNHSWHDDEFLIYVLTKKKSFSRLKMSQCVLRIEAQTQRQVTPSVLDLDSFYLCVPLRWSSSLWRWGVRAVTFSPPGAACPSRSDSCCTDTGIDFLSCNSCRYYTLHYPHDEKRQVLLTQTVRQCSRGNVRSYGIWKRSVVCRHTWYVIQLSIYSEDSHTFQKYYTETWRKPWGMCQSTITKDMSSHYGFNSSTEHTLLCWKVREHSKTVDAVPWRTVSRPLCNDSF